MGVRPQWASHSAPCQSKLWPWTIAWLPPVGCGHWSGSYSGRGEVDWRDSLEEGACFVHSWFWLESSAPPTVPQALPGIAAKHRAQNILGVSMNVNQVPMAGEERREVRRQGESYGGSEGESRSCAAWDRPGSWVHTLTPLATEPALAPTLMFLTSSFLFVKWE